MTKEAHWESNKGNKIFKEEIANELRKALNKNDEQGVLLLQNMLKEMGADKYYPELFL